MSKQASISTVDWLTQLNVARVLMFSIWLSLFVGYIVLMRCTSFKRAITHQQATEAAWLITYILLPVLTAFASFFFAPLSSERDAKFAKKSESYKIGKDRLFVMITLTIAVHLIILLNFILSIYIPDWADETKQTQTFDEALASGLKLMVFLSSLAVLPVGWLLNPVSPQPIGIATPPKGNAAQDLSSSKPD
jgi:hypothetical protein